jgi:hypothetical protein
VQNPQQNVSPKSTFSSADNYACFENYEKTEIDILFLVARVEIIKSV